MGYSTEETGPLVATSKAAVPISGVCAVFADFEVINQLSMGAPSGDIMHGAISSLVDRSVHLMKRVQMEPEYTLIGAILRFGTMARVVRGKLKAEVNVPDGEMVQFTTALGAAILGHQRLRKLKETGVEDSRVATAVAGSTFTHGAKHIQSGFKSQKDPATCLELLASRTGVEPVSPP